MVSLRAIAACVGFPSGFSVLRDFFGYRTAPPWTQAPSQVGLPQSLSLLVQIKRVRMHHFHLNGVRVGTGADTLLSAAQEQCLDCAVQITRDIYAAAGIGIARFERKWHIPLAWNTGHELIADDDEAEDLVDEFTVPNDGIDSFAVIDFQEAGVVGTTPAKSDGVVFELRTGNFSGTGRTLAHELGHFFGLGHENDTPLNLMCQSQFAAAMPASIQLSSDQVDDIEDDDHIKGAC